MTAISIIMPVYNQADRMGLCIKSLLTQTFTDFELVLVNDGSTDDSSTICDNYSKQHDRISVIHREQHDPASAKNTGIAHSSGEYIAFIECEDFLHEQMLEVLYQQMTFTGADIALCDFQPIEEGEERNENRRKNHLSNYTVTTVSGTQALNGLYDTDRLFSVPWSKIYRKDLFSHIGYPKGRADDDEFIAHRLLYKADKVVYVHEPLYFYVVCEGRKGSVVPIPMTAEKFDKVLALYKRAVFFRVQQLEDLERKALDHFIEHFFWYYMQSEQELPEAEDRRREIKRLFNKLFVRMLTIAALTNKQKVIYATFYLSPAFHKRMVSWLEGKKMVKHT